MWEISFHLLQKYISKAYKSTEKMGRWFPRVQNAKCRLKEIQRLQPHKNNVIFKTLLLKCYNTAQKVASYNIWKLFHLIYSKALIWQQKGHSSVSHLWLYWRKNNPTKNPFSPFLFLLVTLHSMPKIILRNNQKWEWYFFLQTLLLPLQQMYFFFNFCCPYFYILDLTKKESVTKKKKAKCVSSQ